VLSAEQCTGCLLCFLLETNCFEQVADVVVHSSESLQTYGVHVVLRAVDQCHSVKHFKQHSDGYLVLAEGLVNGSQVKESQYRLRVRLPPKQIGKEQALLGVVQSPTVILSREVVQPQIEESHRDLRVVLPKNDAQHCQRTALVENGTTEVRQPIVRKTYASVHPRNVLVQAPVKSGQYL
jgi:hypothetical protein